MGVDEWLPLDCPRNSTLRLVDTTHSIAYNPPLSNYLLKQQDCDELEMLKSRRRGRNAERIAGRLARNRSLALRHIC